MPATVSTVMSMKTPSAPPRNPGALMQQPKGSGGQANVPQFDSEEEVKLDDSGDVIETKAPPAPTNKEQSKEKSAEVVEEKEDESTVAPVKKEEAAKETEEEIGFNLPEEKKTDVEEKVAEPKTPAKETIPSGPRNYDSYPEEIRPVLRALNNAQFKQFAPALKELVEKSKKVVELEERLNGKPQFFYEHPEAYKLDPEFNQIVSDINAIRFESSHWQDQMMRIEKGESWYDIQGYDQQGQPIYKEYPAPEDGTVDYRIKAAVQQKIAQLASLDINSRNRLSQFQAQYQGGRQVAQQELDFLDKKLFPNIPDCDKLSVEERKYYDVAGKLVPRAFSGHPLMRPLGKAYVGYMRLYKMYKDLGHKYDKLRGIGEDGKFAEVATIPTGGVDKVKKQLKRGEIDPDEEVKLGSDED